MMKKFLVALIIFLSVFASCEGAILEKGESVAVMDFGLLKDVMEENLLLDNTIIADYFIERLVEIKYFNVVDREQFTEKFQEQNLKVVGLIDADNAKKIGEILGVRYLIYGNVTDVSLDEENFAFQENFVAVNKVKARVIARIVDIESGKILMAAKGEGKSESALVNLDDKISITLGTKKVSQAAVHNALKKAAFQSAEILIERLSGSKIDRLFDKNK